MIKPPPPRGLVPWAETYLSFFAVWYYSSYFFGGLLLIFIIRALKPFHASTIALCLFAIAALLELAYWRYRRWRPEKSIQFGLGASEVITLVHTEGILHYKRDGKEYALYSNRVSDKDTKAN